MSKSKLLLLTDVFYKDMFEELHNKNIKLQEKTSEKNIIHKLPDKFYDKSKWCKTTKLKCLYDGFTFNEVPIFIPIIINIDDSMTTYGCFCSFPCAVKWLETEGEFDSDKKSELKKNMLILYKALHNKKPEFILSAENKMYIKEYGGSLSIIKWREQNENKIKLTLPI